MDRRIVGTVLAALALACATGRGAPAPRPFDQLPPPAALPEGADRDVLEAALAHEVKGDGVGGTNEQGRTEWAAAAAGFSDLAARPALAEWRVPLRHRAAELYLRAQRWGEGAEAASVLATDAEAGDAARAAGARLAATAAIGAANAAVKAGQLEKLDLGNDKKDARPPAPAWKRVLETADAYLARAAADPELRRATPERRPSGPEIALVAAEVQYAHGELDDARRRLDAALERWPSDPDLLDRAVPLYLATYAARGDRAGQLGAIDRLRARAEAEGAKAPAERKGGFIKVVEALGRARSGGRFAQGEELLRQQKAAEAAQAFEAAAAEAGAPDGASALHNAAVAWDQAGQGAKAAALREKLLRDHPDAPFAGEDVLRLAAFRSRQRDHAAAASLYDTYLRRWPDAPSRCLALRNVASELDMAERAADAAARYLAFGRDERCAKSDPSIAARALVRAGRIFEAQAKAAYSTATGLEGVTDADAKNQVTDAKRRLKGL